MPQYAAALRTYSILDGDLDRTKRNNSGSQHQSRADRLRSCRQNAWFTRHNVTGEVRVAASACSLRWCPVCGNARRNYMTHSIADWLAEADHPKMITLTLKHTRAPLDHQITHLYNFFRNLRRRRDFKTAVHGGIWFFQIKKSKTDGLWHPHIHALVTGLYLARRRLSRMWCEVTYGSVVSEIRAVCNPKSAANDAARYATSPGNLIDVPPDDAIALVEALHRRRICGTWGSGRGISLRPKMTDPKGTWQPIGSWSVVFSLYDSNADARAIVLSWKTGVTLPEGISCNRIDEAIKNLGDPGWADYDFESVYDHERPPP